MSVLTASNRVLTDAWSWLGRAACRGVDVNVFYVDSSQSRGDRERAVRAAKRICGECEVRQQCLRYALPRPDVKGIWGGYTDKERSHLRTRLGLRVIIES